MSEDAPRRGLRYDDSDADALWCAIESIVDFRGDVTITRRSTGESIVGYVFDCVNAEDRSRAELRLLPADGANRVVISLGDIAAIELTGRDTAEGKSFETWVRKYAARKLARAGAAGGEPGDAATGREDDVTADAGSG